MYASCVAKIKGGILMMEQCGNQVFTNGSNMMGATGGSNGMGNFWNGWNLVGFGNMNGWLSIIVMVGIVYLIYRVVKNHSVEKKYKSSKTQETAGDILLKEFMKGQISEAEYLQKKAYLD